MADNAHSAGFPACNPTVPSTLPTDSNRDTQVAWDEAFASLQKLKARSDAADKLSSKIHTAYLAVRPTTPTNLHPVFGPLGRDHVLYGLDLDAFEAEHLSLEGKTWWASAKERASMLAGINAVREWRAARDLAREQTGYNAACDTAEALGSELAEKSWTLLLMPAPDLVSTYWKLDYLFGDQIGEPHSFSCSYQMEALAAIMADVRRFSGLEG